MKMVGLGKQKKESMADRSSVGPEELQVKEVVEEVKPREPLSGENQEDGMLNELNEVLIPSVNSQSAEKQDRHVVPVL